MVIFRRLFKGGNVGKTTYFDWFLVMTLFLVTTSGIATEAVRLAELATASYWLYLVHLWLMSVLLIYAPFSKGAHIFYRALAMTYAKQIGRGIE
jgi:quinone-modifying oxidoreductase subunit QmoC